MLLRMSRLQIVLYGAYTRSENRQSKTSFSHFKFPQRTSSYINTPARTYLNANLFFQANLRVSLPITENINRLPEQAFYEAQGLRPPGNFVLCSVKVYIEDSRNPAINPGGGQVAHFIFLSSLLPSRPRSICSKLPFLKTWRRRGESGRWKGSGLGR